MKRFSPLRAGAPSVFLTLLQVACSNDPTAVSPESRAPVATFEATNGKQTVVVETRDIDQRADGVVDYREVLTTRYDVHGNAVFQSDESTDLSGRFNTRATATSEYNNHGDLVGFVFDGDQDADGVVDDRTIMTTVETDKQGHPLRQSVGDDVGANGSVDFAVELTNEFDSRGRLIAQSRASQKQTYQFDEHDNVVRSVQHATTTSVIDVVATADYSAHDAMLAAATNVTVNGLENSTARLTSLAFDGQGYPTLQNLDRTSRRSGPRGPMIPTSHLVREITYDGHHRIVLQVDSEYTPGDARIQSRTTTRSDYGSGDGVIARGWHGAGAGNMAGDSHSGLNGGKGLKGLSGRPFAR